MLVRGVEIPDQFQFDYITGNLVRQTELPLDVLTQLADNTPCPVIADGRLCGEHISVSTARWMAPRAGHQDEFALTGGWRCKAGHGPKHLAHETTRDLPSETA